MLTTHIHTCTWEWDRPVIIDSEWNRFMYNDTTMMFANDIDIRWWINQSVITLPWSDWILETHENTVTSAFPYEIKGTAWVVVNILTTN